MKKYKPSIKPGDVITFRGVAWDAQWEFDCPTVLYHPVKRYHISGSSEIVSMVEDVCYDLASGDGVERGFHESDLKEFEWRGWSPKNFHRRRGCHMEVKVRFTKPDDGYDELNFEIISEKEVQQ